MVVLSLLGFGFKLFTIAFEIDISKIVIMWVQILVCVDGIETSLTLLMVELNVNIWITIKKEVDVWGSKRGDVL